LGNFRDEVVDHLSLLGPVTCRPLLGGYGLYHEGGHFGLIVGARLYLRADASSKFEYQRRGMAAYDPNPRQPHGWFFEVPGEVLDDRDTLLTWARQAVQADTAAKT
jgi:DNA transformation protein